MKNMNFKGHNLTMIPEENNNGESRNLMSFRMSTDQTNAGNFKRQPPDNYNT